ncbi:HEAT repeat-containing protein 3 isoform X2 [Conger conger]|uniref:HEAT repeat-containing protein 3 isoform X2 n=1 Tax=Conger conger TaxID=82655 RepID=UPI002A5A3FFC|nr:HEAT repeat-containing protein 3 isoform X2 [Conger conger]
MGKSKNKKFRRPQFSAEGLPVSAVKNVEDEEEVESPADELLEKCCTGFDSSSGILPKSPKDQKNLLEAVANEAVNLLWNLCECSSQALSVFNKAGLLNVLIQCIERHPHNMELALSAARCLHTVTEENAELLGSLNMAVLGGLEAVLLSSHPGMGLTLLRILAAGSVWNMKSSLPSDRQAQILSAVVATLSHCLELDAGALVPALLGAEAVRCMAGPAGADGEAREGEMEEDEEEEEGDGSMRNRKTAKRDNDFSDLLPVEKVELREAATLLEAQQTSLEIIGNLCCSDDPSDDEWEETSSSDEGELCSDSVCEGNSSLLSPLCLSAEVHSALLNHNMPEKVLKKTEFPSSAAVEVCSKNRAWNCLIKKMHRVQCRALTCLHNIMSVMDAEALGGAPALQALAEHLSNMIFSKPEIPKQEEFLEAVTSAVRSLLQIMASKNIPQCMSPEQLLRLSEAATRSEAVSIRVNALAILGITGSTLAREQGSAPSLQVIGSALLQVASKDHNMVVCGEALDALFDVFADGKEAEQAAKNIHLLPSLKALQPAFKAKLRKERKGKYSPGQLCVLDNVRINLKRFIGYLESLP